MRYLHALRCNDGQRDRARWHPRGAYVHGHPDFLTVGANRIIPTIAIPHPLGDPSLPHDEEKALRRKLVEKALKALTTEVEDQTVFED